MKLSDRETLDKLTDAVNRLADAEEKRITDNAQQLAMIEQLVTQGIASLDKPAKSSKPHKGS